MSWIGFAVGHPLSWNLIMPLLLGSHVLAVKNGLWPLSGHYQNQATSSWPLVAKANLDWSFHSESQWPDVDGSKMVKIGDSWTDVYQIFLDSTAQVLVCQTLTHGEVEEKPETTEMRMRESKEGCQGDSTIRMDQDFCELFAKYRRPQQPFGRTSKTQILAKGRDLVPLSSYWCMMMYDVYKTWRFWPEDNKSWGALQDNLSFLRASDSWVMHVSFLEAFLWRSKFGVVTHPYFQAGNCFLSFLIHFFSIWRPPEFGCNPSFLLWRLDSCMVSCQGRKCKRMHVDINRKQDTAVGRSMLLRRTCQSASFSWICAGPRVLCEYEQWWDDFWLQNSSRIRRYGCAWVTGVRER